MKYHLHKTILGVGTMLARREALGVALGLGVLAMLPITANAGVLYDNITATSIGMDPIQTFGPLSNSFSTGGTASAFTDLKLLVAATSPADGGSFTVSLLSDNSTSPGTVLDLLATIEDSSLSASLSTIDIPLSSINLAASTRYWIQLASSTTSGVWSFSSDTSGVGVASEFFANQNGVFPNSEAPYQMEVSTLTTTVPEPSSLAFLVTGLLGLGAVRRRRKES